MIEMMHLEDERQTIMAFCAMDNVHACMDSGGEMQVSTDTTFAQGSG